MKREIKISRADMRPIEVTLKQANDAEITVKFTGVWLAKDVPYNEKDYGKLCCQCPNCKGMLHSIALTDKNWFFGLECERWTTHGEYRFGEDFGELFDYFDFPDEAIKMACELLGIDSEKYIE